MDKVIIWVNENKEWFFSGIGVTIVTLIFAAIRKVFCKKKQEKKKSKNITEGDKNADSIC